MNMYTLVAGVALLLSGTAYAQSTPTPGGGCTPGVNTFCVTNAGDNGGTNPSAGSGTGTLRQAMVDANTAGGTNTIGFAIPGTGPQTITLASALPTLNPNGNLTSLTIDGTSQPGSVLNTNTPDQGGLNTKLMIEIAGGGYNGFIFSCCAYPSITVTLQGLNLHDFSSVINGQTSGSGMVDYWNVYGCFIGTNIDGTAATKPVGYAATGLRVGYDSAQIGGTQPWQRNLISGNGYGGVAAGFSGETVIIEGNLIGTDVTGTLAIPNDSPGLNLSSNLPGLRVGCTGAGCTASGHPSRNVISGNYAYGIFISNNNSSGGAQIKGNYIGTDVTGTKALPNGNTASGGGCPTYCGGIQVSGGSSGPALIVGGFNPGEANLIAYNGGPGIWAYDNSGYPAIGASFDNQGNAVHKNASTDIAFTEYGWIPNDPGDADTDGAGHPAPNNKQNYPVIQSASVSGNQLTVKYLVDSATMYSTYPLRIDFYVDIDEGSGAYLVSDSYPASSAQIARMVTLALPANALPLTGFVVTATDANGYTSEISPSVVFDRIFADGFEGH